MLRTELAEYCMLSLATLQGDVPPLAVATTVRALRAKYHTPRGSGNFGKGLQSFTGPLSRNISLFTFLFFLHLFHVYSSFFFWCLVQSGLFLFLKLAFLCYSSTALAGRYSCVTLIIMFNPKPLPLPLICPNMLCAMSVDSVCGRIL